MSEEPRKRPTKSLILSLSVLAILELLYFAGIFNPWRIYRQAKVLINQRSHWQLDEVEGNSSKVTSIHILAAKPLEKSKQQQILDVIRHLGPYEDGHMSAEKMQAIDQLIVMIDVPFQGNECRVYVNQFSPRDRDRIAPLSAIPPNTESPIIAGRFLLVNEKGPVEIPTRP